MCWVPSVAFHLWPFQAQWPPSNYLHRFSMRCLLHRHHSHHFDLAKATVTYTVAVLPCVCILRSCEHNWRLCTRCDRTGWRRTLSGTYPSIGPWPERRSTSYSWNRRSLRISPQGRRSIQRSARSQRKLVCLNEGEASFDLPYAKLSLTLRASLWPSWNERVSHPSLDRYTETRPNQVACHFCLSTSERCHLVRRPHP